MTQRKQPSLTFNTAQKNLTHPSNMSYYAAYTGSHSFTIWFQSEGVEYNIAPHTKTGYTYASKYPLPIHQAIINHYGLKNHIRRWNESHS